MYLFCCLWTLPTTIECKFYEGRNLCVFYVGLYCQCREQCLAHTIYGTPKYWQNEWFITNSSKLNSQKLLWCYFPFPTVWLLSYDLPAPGIPSHPSLLVPLSPAAPSPSSFLDDICWKLLPSSQNLLIPCCALCLAYLCVLA